MAEAAGLTLTSVCAHANLLDPTSPDVYGTHEIIKAVRLANLLGVKQVITTEGDAKTKFGKNLTPQERLFTIREKLQSPIEWAEELGYKNNDCYNAERIIPKLILFPTYRSLNIKNNKHL